MAIIIKNEYQINKIRLLSRLAAKTLEMIKPYVVKGSTTEDLNKIISNYIKNTLNCESAILNYHNFPKSICTSVNDVVCHGIPSKKNILKEGDIINIDITLTKDGYYSDTSKMFIVGKTSYINKKLCFIAKQSLYLAIKLIKNGLKLNFLGRTIQRYIEKQNFSVVKGYCGHGIGIFFHEDPYIFHHEIPNNNFKLKTNMIITVEPMINIGSDKTYLDKDGWSVKTKDKSFSAQYEHTLLIKKYDCEVLTLRSDEIIPEKIFNI